MEGRPSFSRAGSLYYDYLLKNPEMQGVHDRMWERQTPPPYDYYEQDQELSRFGAYTNDDRIMGCFNYGIPLDYLEPDPPRYGSRGRHVYDGDVYGVTYDETQFGNHHDNKYGMRNMGGHRGRFGLRDMRGSRMDRANEEIIDEMGLPSRDHYPRYEYRDNRDLSPGNVGRLGSRLGRGAEPRPDVLNDGTGLDGMGFLTPDRYPRHDYHENCYRSLGDVGGLGSGLTRGVEPHPDGFNDALGLDTRGAREFERGMRDTWAQRRHSFDIDAEADAIRNDFRADHRTHSYRSRYGARPGHHSEFYLEDDDLADDFRGRGHGPRPHHSRYPVEDEFELDIDDVRYETMRPREHFRRQKHQGASPSNFDMKPHKAQRGARSRGRPKRQFQDTSDEDDSEEPRHISDSEDERREQSILRRGRAGIPPVNNITEERLIQPHVQGHRARTTAAAHSTTKPLNSNIADLPRGRRTTPQSPLRPYKRRSRHQTLRPRAHDDASHHKEHVQPTVPSTSAKASLQAPVRPQTDPSATSAYTPAHRPAESTNPIKAAVQEPPRGGPTAQRSTHEADKQLQQQLRLLEGDQDNDARNSHVADVLHTAAAKGQQSSDRDGTVRVESRDACKADVGADSFSDGSDDGFDTPASGSEGSDDEGLVQSFIRITL